MPNLHAILLPGLVSVLFIQSVSAAQDWNLCRIPTFNFIASDEVYGDETTLEADSMDSEGSDILRLSGDVRIRAAEQTIRADNARINKTNEQIVASGNVRFENLDYRLESPAIQIDKRNNHALFNQPRFELAGRHARGEADMIEKLDANRSRFTEFSYTTCDPGRLDWQLRAATMSIDNESGRGTATDTTLYFKGVPFLYLPYFQFPIDDRRLSGVLTPSLGYSESSGATATLPVYWNIAPNYDMTVVPSWYENRGLQLSTENRYLFSSQQGQLDLSYLEDNERDDSRWFQRWRHHIKLGAGVSSELLLADLSDGEIFDDFDDLAPEYNSTRHLERHVDLTRNGATWNSRLLWQNHLTLDPNTNISDRPYNRLPRLTLNGDPKPSIANLTTPVRFEWVEFDRDDSVTGTRANLVTSVAWQKSDSWYFFKPELELGMTDYRLENNPGPDSIVRSLATFSIDSGLVFERSGGANNEWLQTLEPRLFLLHTPFEDQDDIPDFDTSLNARTYRNLFSKNRFTGADRIGDANQVTVGLASRIYDNESGDQLLHLRTGQIFFHKDRRVSLDRSRDQESRSDLITEIDIWPNSRTRMAGRFVYDEETSEIDEKDLSINYADTGFAANLGYYFSEDELEQAAISMVYPVNERWTLFAKVHRSLRFEQPVENLLGLSYESCCWGIKILAGQSGEEDDDFSETDNSLYLELTLKGLSQAGEDIDAKLNNAIPGYIPEF